VNEFRQSDRHDIILATSSGMSRSYPQRSVIVNRTLLALAASSPLLITGCPFDPIPYVGGVRIGEVADVGSEVRDGGSAIAGAAHKGLSRINHFVVIYLENHSFDNLYGEYAGAEGLSSRAAQHALQQLGPDGQPYTSLPMLSGSIFPDNLPNAPFAMDPYLPPADGGPIEATPPDLVHRFYQEQAQINDGGMNYFALVSYVKGQSMGYYHTAQLPLAAVAKQYTLCDHFFHGAFGGSFLNHIWLISASAPTMPIEQALDAGIVSSVDVPLDGGTMVNDGFVTPDGYVVNTAFTVNTPHPPVAANRLVPNQTMPNIGDRLTAAGLSWKWYSGEWNAALDGGAALDRFQYHHQPFAYFGTTADGTAAKAEHLRDETELSADLAAGQLPNVAFIKPAGPDNEHPGYTNVLEGELHAKALIDAIMASSNWHDTAIIVTYDENGGSWDHVAPPKVDRWGPGTRVPAIIISPYAKNGYVDSTEYDTTSILTTIEHRWDLAPLGTRDANGHDLSNAFDFSSR
jgi:phospholipase C